MPFSKIKKFSGLLEQRRIRKDNRQRYAASGGAEQIRAISGENTKVIIYRILGEDLPPRHSQTQTFDNLNSILESEQSFPQCEKRFVVNRIVSEKKESQLIERLEDAGTDYIRIPFEPAEYAGLDWELEPFGGIGFFQSARFLAMSPHEKTLARIWACAPKIRYAMNVNGARNRAIQDGRTDAGWILPLDGNCLITGAFWDALSQTMAQNEFPYLVLPMHRSTPDAAQGNFKKRNWMREEPQLAFHAVAEEWFDETYPYGVMDKAELLMRLGVPGVWNKWSIPEWMPMNRAVSPNRFLFGLVPGYLLRLSSGKSELDERSGQSARYNARNEAILKRIMHLNRAYGTRNPDYEKLILGGAM